MRLAVVSMLAFTATIAACAGACGSDDGSAMPTDSGGAADTAVMDTTVDTSVFDTSTPAESAPEEEIDSGEPPPDVPADMGSCEMEHATGCTDPCKPVRGHRYDAAGMCMRAAETVACALDVLDADASWKCRATTDGKDVVYFFPVYAPEAKGFWRACTGPEAAAMPAPLCP